MPPPADLPRPAAPYARQQRRVSVGEVSLNYVATGAGRPVVLLHGFPEFWYSWRRQLPVLAEAGFHAIAPDLRGYNKSDRPFGVQSYRVSRLVDDIVGLIDAVAQGPVYLVGHDWGGIVAWRLAALYPRLVRKLIVLNAPHPSKFLRYLGGHPRQWLRSSYGIFFQIPWIPERLLSARDFALLRRIWNQQPVRADAFDDADMERYKQALGRAGGLTGPLNYYRAALRYPDDLLSAPQIVSAPTLVLWGERDPALSVELTEGLQQWVADVRVVRVRDASHWLQNDAPERVNRLLIEFLVG